MKYIKFNKSTGDIVANLTVDPSLVSMYTDDSYDIVEIENQVEMSSYWVSNKKILPKQTLTLNSTGTFIPNQLSIITNAPTDCWFRIRGTSDLNFSEVIKKPTSQGNLTYNFPNSGKYIISTIGKYISAPLEIEVAGLDTIKLNRCAEVNVKKQEVINSGFMWNSVKWDSDTGAQASINFAISNINGGQVLPENFYWTSFDNVNIPMTAQDMLDMASALATFLFNVHDKASELKALINGMANIDDVLSLDINANWPN